MDVMAGIYLFVQSILDIRNKAIPLWISLGFGGISFFYSLYVQRTWSSLIYATLSGVLCLLLGYCTKEAIGYGDGILLCALAALYSLEEIMNVVVIACSIAGVVGLILLVIFHKNGKYEIPFVPFLFLGWLFSRGLVIAGGIV